MRGQVSFVKTTGEWITDSVISTDVAIAVNVAVEKVKLRMLFGPEERGRLLLGDNDSVTQ